MEHLTGILQSAENLIGDLTGIVVRDIGGGLSLQVLPYTGDYEFTPAQETQTVAIAGRMATQNITINPIPSNYGRVSWNGAYLHIE